MDKNVNLSKNLDSENLIGLREILNILWSRKKKLSQITLAGILISFLIGSLLPNIYSSSALLAPAEQARTSSNMAQQLGGIASLAGINLSGSADGGTVQLGLALLESRTFIGEFVNRRNLLPELMAAQSWNRSTGQITYDDDIYDFEIKKWVRDVGPPLEPKPSLLEAHEEFMKIMNISQDLETGYVSLTIEHISPTLAAKWTGWLVEDVNSAVRKQHIQEATQSIEYLKEQIETTSLAELQTVFFGLIQSQTEKIMLAQSRPEYVFKVIDPAVVPLYKSKPKRLLIVILGGVIFFMIAFMVILFKHFYSFRL